MTREKSTSVCPNTNSLDQCNWKFCNASASEAAERFAELSAFVYRGYCTGTIMRDVPTSKFMKHLSNGLYTYSFGLVIEKTPKFLTRPGQSTILTMSTAVDAMRQVADFLGKKANDLTVCGLSNETELTLAADLNFAKQYTEGLLRMESNSRTSRKSSQTSDQEVATGDALAESAGPKSDKARGQGRVAEQGVCCAEGSPAEQAAAQQLGDPAQVSSAEQRQSTSILRSNGPSAAQLRANINYLQRQLADLEIHMPSTAESRLHVSPQNFSMPSSPLQGSPSSLHGPHDSCDFGTIQAVSTTASPISAMYKLAEGARLAPPPGQQGIAGLHTSSFRLASRSEAEWYAADNEQNDTTEKKAHGLDLPGPSSSSESSSHSQAPPLKTSQGRIRLGKDWEDSCSQVLEAGCSTRDRLSFV